MPESVPDIVLLDRPIEPHELRALMDRFFEDMVTFRLVGRGEPLP